MTTGYGLDEVPRASPRASPKRTDSESQLLQSDSQALRDDGSDSLDELEDSDADVSDLPSFPGSDKAICDSELEAMLDPHAEPQVDEKSEDEVSVISVPSSPEKKQASSSKPRRLRGKTPFATRAAVQSHASQTNVQCLVGEAVAKMNKDGIFDPTTAKDNIRKKKREDKDQATFKRVAKKLNITLKGDNCKRKRKAMKSMKSMQSMKSMKSKQSVKSEKAKPMQHHKPAANSAEGNNKSNKETEQLSKMQNEGQASAKGSNKRQAKQMGAQNKAEDSAGGSYQKEAKKPRGAQRNRESSTKAKDTGKAEEAGKAEGAGKGASSDVLPKYLVTPDGECQPESEVKIRIFVENDVPRIQVRARNARTIVTLTESHLGGHKATLALAENMKSMCQQGFTKEQICAFKTSMHSSRKQRLSQTEKQE